MDYESLSIDNECEEEGTLYTMHMRQEYGVVEIVQEAQVGIGVCEGVWQGVMSDEVSREAVVKNFAGEFDGVDYSKVDVEFKKIN